jgi:hypothetical protein
VYVYGCRTVDQVSERVLGGGESTASMRRRWGRDEDITWSRVEGG